MAKKGKKKDRKDPTPADAVGAVRTAVERTFQATADGAQSTRTRAQDLVDEVAGAAGRVREMIEDMRVLEDLKGLRSEVDALSRRVAALEAAPKAPAKRSPAAKSSAAPKRSTTTKRSTTSKPSATAKRSTTTKRSTTAKRTAAKPRSSAARKPAA